MSISSLAKMPFGILSDITTEGSSNFTLKSWPPQDEFPIVIDAKGNVVSQYSDARWKLWPWCNKRLSLNFEDVRESTGQIKVSTANSNVLRLIACWLIYGSESVQNAQSLVRKFQTAKIIVKAANRSGILATDFYKFPALVENLAREISPHESSPFVYLMHRLLNDKDDLGFLLLDHSSLKKFSALTKAPISAQTAYIPPRIWNYQTSRLTEFLEDFHAHKANLTQCFEYCLDAYVNAFGSLEAACSVRTEQQRMLSPFSRRHRKVNCDSYKGPFVTVAERFGIADLLQKWVIGPGKTLSSGNRGVSSLSAYFSMTNHVALAMIVSHSMMRVEEAWTLKSDCFRVEHDPSFGNIYCIRGMTTKTLEDDDALWITSPLVEPAVDAASLISSLRSTCELANLSLVDNVIAEGASSLFARAQEPWANRQAQVKGVRAGYNSYAETVRMYPHLFSEHEIRIRQEDLEISRLLTPTLEDLKFAEGQLWPFAWHQLRRTGAVNMQSSGLVSDAAMQYQLKHATRAMSLYYGRGYSSLKLNESARAEYVKTMYEVLAREIESLVDDRYISPYGVSRKMEILKLVDKLDLPQLIAAGKKGDIAWRQTLFGGCTKKGFCEYGGVDNVARCGGGDSRPACADAIFDRAKYPMLKEYAEIIRQRVLSAEPDSPYEQSLMAQSRAVNNVIGMLFEQETVIES